MKKKILVLMSTYNGERFIDEQIQSIFNQKGVDVYLLIRDDGSIDRTVEIIESYKRKFSSSIVEFIKGENCGFGNSFTYLVQYAYKMSLLNNKFDFYAFADQDDVWLENKLQVAVSMLISSIEDKPLLYCSNSTIVDENLISKEYFREKFYTPNKANALIEGLAHGCTMVYNYSSLELYAKHVIPEIKVHDFYLYQIVTFIGEVIYDKNSYMLYRQHGNNQIGKQSFTTRWKGRVKKIFKYQTRVIQSRNYYLLKTIGYLLEDNDIRLISKVAYYYKSLKSRLSLIADKDIKYSSVESNLFFCIKVVFGVF